LAHSNSASNSEEFLTREQLAEMLHVTKRTIEAWHKRGDHPPALRAGQRRVLYKRSDVINWIGARVVRSNAEAQQLAKSRAAA